MRFATMLVCAALGCTPTRPEASTGESSPAPQPKSEPEPQPNPDPDPDPEAAARAAGILGPLQSGSLQGSGPIDIGDVDEDVWTGLSDPDGTVQAKGVVRLAKPRLDEGIDRYAVRRVVRDHLSEVRSCYIEGLDRHPTLAGRVEIAFSITGEGSVSSSSVHSNSLEPVDERVAACIAAAVEHWRFPPPAQGQSPSVVYPFALSPD